MAAARNMFFLFVVHLQPLRHIGVRATHSRLKKKVDLFSESRARLAGAISGFKGC